MVLEQLKDPRLRALLTVTHVKLSEDLRYASVAVSVMGDAATQREALRGMQSAVSFLRHELAHRLRLKHVPDLRFTLDVSMEESERVLQLMERLRAEEANDNG